MDALLPLPDDWFLREEHPKTGRPPSVDRIDSPAVERPFVSAAMVAAILDGIERDVDPADIAEASGATIYVVELVRGNIPHWRRYPPKPSRHDPVHGPDHVSNARVTRPIAPPGYRVVKPHRCLVCGSQNIVKPCRTCQIRKLFGY